MEGQPSFLVRHEFLLRRLHSLTGLVPVGAYMVIHLLTNASIWNGPASFQGNVYKIHSLGRALPVVEWLFIFLPILFHGIYGLVILRESQPNSGSYPFASNLRYTLQRATGMIAFLFIGWHVFHMHGWIHTESWRKLIDPWGGQFAPYNAVSTAAEAMQQSSLVILLYAIGVTACVFHLANGVWTMGITWGLWTTPAAQRRANYIALGLGLFVLLVGAAAWSGFAFKINTHNPQIMKQVRDVEARMLKSKIEAGELTEEEAEHKRARDRGQSTADSGSDVTASAAP